MRRTNPSAPRARLLGSLAGPCLYALALVLAVSTAHAAKGTGSAGYRWLDSDEADCPFPSMTLDRPTFTILGDEGTTGPIPIGFPFRFYNQFWNDVWISSNGWIALSSPSGPFPTAGGLPSLLPPNNLIAPLWMDLDGITVSHGFLPGPGYFFVQWIGQPKNNTYSVAFEVRLFPTGRIQMVYDVSFIQFSIVPRQAFVSGIEDAAGTNGILLWNHGSGTGGYNFRPSHAVCYLPPPNLACGASLTCNSSTPATTSAAPRNVSGYDCDPGVTDGGEVTYRMNLTGLTDFRADLSGLGGRDLNLYLLDGCDEEACLEGGVTSLPNRLLGPGSYTLVVDGPLAAEGGYTLTTSCALRSAAATCPSTQVGVIPAGASWIDSYDCVPGEIYPGAEIFYDVAMASPGNLRVRLAAACELDTFIFAADEVGSTGCLAHGRGGATLHGAPAGSYVIAIDGRNGAACPFTADFGCGVDLTCAPAPTITCGDVVSATTVGLSNAVSDYSCRPDEVLDGNEIVYRLQPPVSGSIGVQLENPSSPDLRAFVLSACDEGSCMDEGSSACAHDSALAPPAYAVVDGLNGATGSFDLRVVCGPRTSTHQDWREAETPFAPTGPETRASDGWHFDTAIPTASDPYPSPVGSYCGTGLDSTFYLPINCPGALHLVLNDVESAAGVSLRDAQSGRRLLLDATNHGGKTGTTPWTAAGYDIGWLSSPCRTPVPPTPPDLGKDDYRFSDARVDVSAAVGEDPCGLWRVELRSVGGVDWDLFANCSGDAAPGHVLYDNLCDAAAAYAPRAELQVSNLRTDGNCPRAQVQFEIENLGCAVVDAPWRLDAGPGNVIDGVTAGLAPGFPVTITQSVDVTAPTGKVMAFADPLTLLLECSEALGTSCSVAGTHAIDFQACTGCTTPMPPTAVIGNDLRAVRAAATAVLSWNGAPVLPTGGASHVHVMRTDRKSGGAWSNLALPDTLVAPTLTDPTPLAPLSFYQVRFASDCEGISGGSLP